MEGEICPFCDANLKHRENGECCHNCLALENEMFSSPDSPTIGHDGFMKSRIEVIRAKNSAEARKKFIDSNPNMIVISVSIKKSATRCHDGEYCVYYWRDKNSPKLEQEVAQ